jgi:hypothetical protein
MVPSDIPWIEEAGYWHKRVPVGNQMIDLSVGLRAKTDGTVFFQPMIYPTAVANRAKSDQQLSKQYYTLDEAKKICDEVALIIVSDETIR